MVSLDDIQKEIQEMTMFYINLPSRVVSDGDKTYAVLAKTASEQILKLITKYRDKPQNKILKQLHANVMTLTRGVEYFEHERTEHQHRAYGHLRLRLLEWLESTIKMVMIDSSQSTTTD